MSQHYIQRQVELQMADYKIVRAYAEESGLGSQDFSKALRRIIREWRQRRQQEWSEPRPTEDEA